VKTIVRSLLVAILLAPATAAAQTADDLFNPDVVHRLDLLVNSRDWEKLKTDFQLNDYYPADIKWNGLTVHNAGIRSRGLGSRSGVKPALRVDMNRYAIGQQFLGLKSFLLDNLVQDPTGIKELVAMRLYQRMGLPAPREAHVALYVNNTYAGVYAIIESVDKDFLARVFGERAPGDTENDGYLFEFDFVEPWYFNYMGSGLEFYASRFDPQTHEQAPMETLYRPIEAMTRAINEAPDATFVEAVSPYLDLPLFMRHLAVQTFIAEPDGILGYAGMANFHFYRFEESTRSQFIAWDEDKSFDAADRPILIGHNENVLVRRAMAVPALRAAFFDGLLEVSASAMASNWLQQEIQTRRAQVTPFMLVDPVKPYTNDEFESALNALVAFPAARSAFVATQVPILR
jgi:spore coat protein H